MKLTGHVDKMDEDQQPMTKYVDQEKGRSRSSREKALETAGLHGEGHRRSQLEVDDWVAQDRGQWGIHGETCSHIHS